MRFLAFFFVFSLQNLWSSPEIDTLYVTSNEDTLEFEKKSKIIYFICPLSNCDKQKYLEKFSVLLKKKRIQNINNVNFQIVFFHDNVKYRSKGLRIRFSKIDSLILFNDFNVVFQNFDKNQLLFTSNREEIKKTYNLFFYNFGNLAKVNLNESIACYSSTDERIPNYENFISQLVNPVFSELERISFLEDSIKKLNVQLDTLFDRLKKFDERMEKLEGKAIPLNYPLNENQPINNKCESKEESPNTRRRNESKEKN
jgi:hypothetical protein